MLDPIEEWDADYLVNEVVPHMETETLEKKASAKFTLTSKGKPTGDTKDEIAKQVSAFSNSGQGFLVYGIDDEKKQLDDGIPMMINRQPTNDWVEALIPDLLHPPVTGCVAKMIQVPGHHLPDRGVLVVSIPLSEGRPHWTTDQEIAYIRAGAHSSPMRPQTLIDMVNRRSASVGEIVDLGVISDPQETEQYVNFDFRPVVCIRSGGICRDWAIDIETLGIEFGYLSWVNLEGVQSADPPLKLSLIQQTPLFPGRPTPVSPDGCFTLFVRESPSAFDDSGRVLGPQVRLDVTFYTDSGKPATRVFTLRDFPWVQCIDESPGLELRKRHGSDRA